MISIAKDQDIYIYMQQYILIWPAISRVVSATKKEADKSHAKIHTKKQRLIVVVYIESMLKLLSKIFANFQKHESAFTEIFHNLYYNSF